MFNPFLASFPIRYTYAMSNETPNLATVHLPATIARNAGNTLDLGEQVLLPGLINAHCHLDYTCLRGKIPPQKSFTEWIRAINAEKATLAPKDYIASINEGFAEAKRFGTTTIANLTVFPELIPQIQPPVRTCWFAELIDIRAPERANELVDAAIESLGRARPELVLSEAEGKQSTPPEKL